MPKVQQKLTSFFKKISSSSSGMPSHVMAGSANPGLDAVGHRIKVYREQDDTWYEGKVISFATGTHEVAYDDGEREMVDLASVKYAFLSQTEQTRRSERNQLEVPINGRECEDRGRTRVTATSLIDSSSDGPSDIRKRRYIVIDDDDEENIAPQVGERVDSHGSANDGDYVCQEEAADPDRDDIDVDDDTHDRDDCPRKKRKAELKSTTDQTTMTKSIFDAKVAHQRPKMTAPVTMVVTLGTVPTPDHTQIPSLSLSKTQKNGSTLEFNEVNLTDESRGRRVGVYPAGAHTHDMEEWYWILTKKRVDVAGREPSDPYFDRRTMRLPCEWSQIETSPVRLQWWRIKSRFADCLLFFKIGRFYEMYHTDADAGVEHAGLVYMKGEQAHCGFPEQAYGKYLDLLVNQGFKIARVEQTETPEQNKDRIARARNRGCKPNKQEQAMRREVCSLTTPSTRCYSYLELATMVQDSSRASSTGAGTSSTAKSVSSNRGDSSGACDNIGGMLSEPNYLVAIKREQRRRALENRDSLYEAEIENSEDNHLRGERHRNQTEHSQRYGVCVVDCARGLFVLAEFEDDVETSTRLRTMLNEFPPVEVLLERDVEGGLADLVRCSCASSLIAPSCIEALAPGDEFWDAQRTTREIRGILPKNSKNVANNNEDETLASWPEVLKLAVEGEANLCVSALGAVTWWLRRCLIDVELLSMGNFDVYTPPDVGLPSAPSTSRRCLPAALTPRQGVVAFDEAILVCSAIKVKREEKMRLHGKRTSMLSEDVDGCIAHADDDGESALVVDDSEADCDLFDSAQSWERAAPRMAMDAASRKNLHVLESGAVDKKTGSLWGLVHPGVSTAMGSRRLRSWLLRPLADARDIKERADAVEELVRRTDSAKKLAKVLKKVPDLERLMQQIHTLGSARRAPKRDTNDDDDMNQHPDARAVLFDALKFNGKKVQQLVDAIRGLKASEEIMEPPEDDDGYDEVHCPSDDDPHSDIGSGARWRSRLLRRCCMSLDERDDESVGCFPALARHLAQFEEGFDLDAAKRDGKLESRRGSDDAYDAAVDNRAAAECALKEWLSKERKTRRCAELEYVTAAKDRYCVRVPEDAFSRGRPLETLPSGWTQRSKTKKSRVFEVHAVKPLVQALEDAEGRVNKAKLDQLRCLFFAFDQRRHRWAAAVACVATLDSLLALARASRRSGFCRPTFIDETSQLPGGKETRREPCLKIENGAHPCLDVALAATNAVGTVDVIGNDVELGTSPENGPVLILSGPNMGGKSTLLRHVCCSTILAQVGCFVKANAMELTPVDRIFTRLGASDRINEGQSTFMVELLETATILNYATPRSLCILDELGRGTATFDGMAIAYAVLEDLAVHIRCRTLFSTHYHDMVRQWTGHPRVQTGFMDFLQEDERSIVFLYKLVAGICPRSFGIHVAGLANLPECIIQRAIEKSEQFEERINCP